MRGETAVHKRSSDSTETLLLLLKHIIVSEAFADREGRGHRALPSGSEGHRELVNCTT